MKLRERVQQIIRETPPEVVDQRASDVLARLLEGDFFERVASEDVAWLFAGVVRNLDRAAPPHIHTVTMTDALSLHEG